eukprot:1976813-Rhodomonas_salina.1
MHGRHMRKDGIKTPLPVDEIWALDPAKDQRGIIEHSPQTQPILSVAEPNRRMPFHPEPTHGVELQIQVKSHCLVCQLLDELQERDAVSSKIVHVKPVTEDLIRLVVKEASHVVSRGGNQLH